LEAAVRTSGYSRSVKLVSELIQSPSQLGKLIRQRRKAAGLTQRELADLGDVGTRFLSELERGKPTCQIGKTLAILKLLGLELRLTARGGSARESR
jgi:HTH-type transcriptional regulator / antitoxin HipB